MEGTHRWSWLVVAYAPTEANPDAELKEVSGRKLGHIVNQIPAKESLFVQIDANSRSGRRTAGCHDGRVLEAYGRDELNNNGKRLLSLASDNKLALTNTIFSARKGEISRTFNAITTENGWTTS